MPLRINEITSNVNITGGDTAIRDAEIERIVRIVIERVKQELKNEQQILEESSIKDQASEVEPY